MTILECRVLSWCGSLAPWVALSLPWSALERAGEKLHLVLPCMPGRADGEQADDPLRMWRSRQGFESPAGGSRVALVGLQQLGS